MTTLATETWTGTNGAAWPAQWSFTGQDSGAGSTIQANAGQQVVGTAGAAIGFLGNVAAFSNFDVTVDFTASSTAGLAAVSAGALAFSIWPSSGYSLALDVHNNGVYINRFDASGAITASSTTTAFTFTSATTYHVRFRNIGGTVTGKVWTGASEPGSWTVSFTDGSPWTSMQLQLGIYAESSVAWTGTWDNLTLTNAASPAMSTLVDTFATKDTTKWTWGAAAADVSGQCQLTANTSYTGVIDSTAAYDLTGSAAFVQLVQPVQGSGTGTPESFFILFDSGTNADNKNALSFDVLGANLVLGWKNSAGTATTLATLAYSATNHAWWRIRQASSTFFWETSPDGATWTQQASLASSNVPFTSMRAELGAGYSGTFTPSAPAIFDNVNSPPVAVSNLHLGANTPSALYLGGSPVSAVYLGTTKVW